MIIFGFVSFALIKNKVMCNAKGWRIAQYFLLYDTQRSLVALKTVLSNQTVQDIIKPGVSNSSFGGQKNSME